MTKIISWNVNGIRAALKKDFLTFVEKENPDILCIQETKAHLNQVDKILDEYPYHFWNEAKKKGYAGTAIFSKHEPLSVKNGIGKQEHDAEGRVITLEFKTYYVVTVYIPNSGRGLPRLDYRKEWDKDFLHYVQKLEKEKPVIVCGDFNVAHTEIDLANPKSNYNKTAGYTQIEIDGFQRFIDHGFVDTFREFHTTPGHYSYWGYWNNLRKRNIGWRIDYFLISKKLRQKLKKAFILSSIMGSDHCPVGIEIE
ncbi:exodeoxyribonuclease III [Candidatus Woesearchaeota archaeon CG10_big_fil_rev_8_21_14_0_10_36_11]|nr:MAG: exodeoxyribonuclease III [Candidatus Woesearchaeota archaeon CG10_big_fil_rev_8_21_14_0_10_36_11]